jgi:hypothetical protein
MDTFMKLVDLFSESKRVEICKSLIEVFCKEKNAIVNDLVVIHSAFDMAKTLHDSIDSMSFDDERRQISQLVCKFVRKVSFGTDLEQHLNFFVDCRQGFVNLDSVKDTLVMGVLQLVNVCHKIVRGRHSKKTIAFVKACLAYVHITVPSIEDRMLRLNLFLLAGQVSLVHGLMAQADTFFKTAITLIPDMIALNDVPSEDAICNFFNSFSSALVVVPGHPEKGPFYLVIGLLNVVNEYPWTQGSSAKVKVYLNMLALLSSYWAPKLPYHIAKMESNDVLYAKDEEYLSNLQGLIDKLVEQILTELTAIKSCSLALDMLNRLFAEAAINPGSASLAIELCSTAKKGASTSQEQKYLKNTMEHIAKVGAAKGGHYKELATKLAST